jgi:hypothetical protein
MNSIDILQCRLLQTIADKQNLSAVLLLELRSLDPDLKARHASRRRKFEGLWKEIIIEGKNAGKFNNIDPSLAGRAILGIMNWTVTWYRPDGQRSAEDIANIYSDLLLEGLMVK